MCCKCTKGDKEYFIVYVKEERTHWGCEKYKTVEVKESCFVTTSDIKAWWEENKEDGEKLISITVL